MSEAVCQECGAIYEFEGEKLPKVIRCICECTKFKVSAEA